MIKLVRIDDRLIHGQVAFTWVPSLGVNYVIVANDKVAKDEFQKMTLGLARPAIAKLLITSISGAIGFLNDRENQSLKILVLINNIKDAASLAENVAEIKSINFGGIRSKEGSTLISKAIAISNDDLPLLHDMIQKSVELEVRQVPTDSKVLVTDLIKNLA
ncbi:MAG TPA: PTS sugar transporter subunit IIB [Puia sp.]|jgi:fructoselysine and glucoselysine-specific PTS system IIB component|nr:PTS sugar transporter subunit IIB [Puia sp.]